MKYLLTALLLAGIAVACTEATDNNPLNPEDYISLDESEEGDGEHEPCQVSVGGDGHGTMRCENVEDAIHECEMSLINGSKVCEEMTCSDPFWDEPHCDVTFRPFPVR
jgi:hypothetical protein